MVVLATNRRAGRVLYTNQRSREKTSTERVTRTFLATRIDVSIGHAIGVEEVFRLEENWPDHRPRL
jgi:hypothetical protein